MNSLKDRIDLIRESKGMRQVEFAKELGISAEAEMQQLRKELKGRKQK